jgi:predicted metal-dependent HD superfamily phosphohydrolase
MNEYKTKINKVYEFAHRYMQKHTNHAYHNFVHAVDVRDCTLRIAHDENLGQYEKFLLGTAALMHDLIVEKDNLYNEERSAMLAQEVLPNLGYSKYEVQEISKLILATKLPTKPNSKLEQVMCDADLDNLGRTDFLEKGEQVRQELGMERDAKWYERLYKFLENQNYYTDSAKKDRVPGLKRNMGVLEKILEKEETKC